MFKCQQLKYAILTTLYLNYNVMVLLSVQCLESLVRGRNNEICNNKIKYLCNLILCFKVNQELNY